MVPRPGYWFTSRWPCGRLVGNTWTYRLGVGVGGAALDVLTFGGSLQTPLLADWTSDGIITPASFRDGNWSIDWDGDGSSNQTVSFGTAGDIPIVGDWNGDGYPTPGLVRNGGASNVIFKSDSFGNQAGPAVLFGIPTDTIIVGDFNGDGIDTLGAVRVTGNTLSFFLDTTGDGLSDQTCTHGANTDIPGATGFQLLPMP